jgi:hypothetical protein
MTIEKAGLDPDFYMKTSTPRITGPSGVPTRCRR